MAKIFVKALINNDEGEFLVEENGFPGCEVKRDLREDLKEYLGKYGPSKIGPLLEAVFDGDVYLLYEVELKTDKGNWIDLYDPNIRAKLNWNEADKKLFELISDENW